MDGLQGFADDLRHLAELERDENLEAMKAFGNVLLNDPNSSLNRLVRAVQELNQAGY